MVYITLKQFSSEISIKQPGSDFLIIANLFPVAVPTLIYFFDYFICHCQWCRIAFFPRGINSHLAFEYGAYAYQFFLGKHNITFCVKSSEDAPDGLFLITDINIVELHMTKASTLLIYSLLTYVFE